MTRGGENEEKNTGRWDIKGGFLDKSFYIGRNCNEILRMFYSK